MDINATLFVEMVIFLAFSMITKHYIWPPIMHTLDERRALINQGLQQADLAKAALENAEMEAQKCLHDATKKTQNIIKEAHREAQLLINDTRENCNQRIRLLEQELAEKARQAQQDAEKAIESKILKIAIAVCKNTLSSDKLDQGLIDKLIAQQSSTEGKC